MEKVKRKLLFFKRTVKNDINLYRYFGLKIAFFDFIRNCVFHGTQTEFGKRFDKHNHQVIKEKCKKSYSEIVDKYKTLDFSANNIDYDCPIWVFWWQGFDEKLLPPIVKTCVDSIEKNRGKHRVIRVSKENYREFISVPQYILDKFAENKISITLFSDVLRMELLAKYGGIWTDATLFLTSELDEEIYRYPFYTIHHGLYADFHVCRGLWSTFFLGVGQDNPFPRFMKDFFEAYYKNEEMSICYLLLDVAIAIAYEEFSWFREMVDSVPINNSRCFELQDRINEKYDPQIFKDITRNCSIHKLNYKYFFGNDLESIGSYILRSN
ncbi:capsular polysaccharide synthesis protein [Butyrivibrio sp.]|uniref:capsular polysaccharide synthesis protein n=1 Tax=Butyrivibrio sp. TaxID=28121 RepID=UPI0025BD02AD|nr:capsular polysaccharide synthesis protein [Butyrivibrio sp.]